MKEAKLFQNGQSQAVRLPKEFRFEGNAVGVQRIGEVVVLVPLDNPWEGWWNSFKGMGEDFMKDREQGEVEEREAMFEE